MDLSWTLRFGTGVFMRIMIPSSLYLEAPRNAPEMAEASKKICPIRSSADDFRRSCENLAILCFMVDALYQHRLRYRTAQCSLPDGSGSGKDVTHCRHNGRGNRSPERHWPNRLGLNLRLLGGPIHISPSLSSRSSPL